MSKAASIDGFGEMLQAFRQFPSLLSPNLPPTTHLGIRRKFCFPGRDREQERGVLRGAGAQSRGGGRGGRRCRGSGSSGSCGGGLPVLSWARRDEPRREEEQES